MNDEVKQGMSKVIEAINGYKTAYDKKDLTEKTTFVRVDGHRIPVSSSMKADLIAAANEELSDSKKGLLKALKDLRQAIKDS